MCSGAQTEEAFYRLPHTSFGQRPPNRLIGRKTVRPYRTGSPVRATSCGFESHLRHSTKILQKGEKSEEKKRAQH